MEVRRFNSRTYYWAFVTCLVTFLWITRDKRVDYFQYCFHFHRKYLVRRENLVKIQLITIWQRSFTDVFAEKYLVILIKFNNMYFNKNLMTVWWWIYVEKSLDVAALTSAKTRRCWQVRGGLFSSLGLSETFFYFHLYSYFHLSQHWTNIPGCWEFFFLFEKHCWSNNANMKVSFMVASRIYKEMLPLLVCHHVRIKIICNKIWKHCPQNSTINIISLCSSKRCIIFLNNG